MSRRRSWGDHFQKTEKNRHVFGGDNLMARNGNQVFSQTIDVHCCQLSPGNEQYLQLLMLRGAFVATSKTFLLASQISNLVLFQCTRALLQGQIGFQGCSSKLHFTFFSRPRWFVKRSVHRLPCCNTLLESLYNLLLSIFSAFQRP